MKRINIGALRPGDIVLTTSDAKASKAIRAVTRSPISHAMLCVDESSVIDATLEGVQARNPQRLFYSDDATIVMLRPKTPLTPSEVKSLTDFVRLRVGTTYGKTQAVATKMPGRRTANRQQFCSRLVAQAYASIGRPLVADADFCSPEELRQSPHLTEIEGSSVAASQDEIDFWEARPDPTQLTRDSQNHVLETARKFDRTIQDFSDLNDFVVRHPEHDAAIAEAYRESGYLELFKHDLAANPERYDLNKLLAIEGRDTEIEAHCRSTVTWSAEQGQRYLNNFQTYRSLQSAYPRKTFDLMVRLYARLTQWHESRVDVATKWLEAKGL